MKLKARIYPFCDPWGINPPEFEDVYTSISIYGLDFTSLNITKKDHKDFGQYAQVDIQKLRGEQSRKFNITWIEWSPSRLHGSIG